MAMEFYILNPSLEIIGLIDTYKSAIWTGRYYTSGDFELYVPATDKNMSLLQKDNYVVRVDDTTKAAIIQRVGISTDAEEGDYITASGKSLKNILSRRIMWKQTRYTGYLEKILRQMVKDNFINADISARNMSQLELGDEIGLAYTMQKQMTGDNIETAMTEICQSYGIGFDILFDLENRKFKFVLLNGVDRSYNQSINPFVVFSPDFDNIISSDYANDKANFKNTAQVAGEGQGVDRVKIAVGNNYAGINRYELFVDARNQSSNSGELSASEYNAILQNVGVEKLAEAAITESVDSEVAANSTYKLNVDYFLGDIVEIINEYGIAMTPRVTEVIEAQDDTGYSCIPKFTTED